jgi:hypothetical protein
LIKRQNAIVNLQGRELNTHEDVQRIFTGSNQSGKKEKSKTFETW